MLSNWSLPVNGDLTLCLVVETSCFAICELWGSAELKVNVWSVHTHTCMRASNFNVLYGEFSSGQVQIIKDLGDGRDVKRGSWNFHLHIH